MFQFFETFSSFKRLALYTSVYFRNMGVIDLYSVSLESAISMKTATKIFVAMKCNEKLTKTWNGWELLLVGQAHPLSSNVCFLGHSNRLTDLNKFNFIKDFMWKILILITTQVKKCFHSLFLKRINNSWFCEFSLKKYTTDEELWKGNFNI